MIKEVVQSDDIQFYWIICFNIDDEQVCDTLLLMITELYLTMRGFAYASIWIERYKQEAKKTTQRSKSLRKDLYNDNIIYYVITRYRYVR